MAMANAKGSSDMRIFMYPGKHSTLPPRTPSPGISSAYGDYFIPPLNSSKAVQKPTAQPHHLRTTSESILIEEQPSWLDDLLNEPETPVRRGHRRSSSDSFAYVGGSNFSKQDYLNQEEYKARNLSLMPLWGSQDFERQKEGWHAPFYAEGQATKKKNWVKELNVPAQLTGLSSSKDDAAGQSAGLSPTSLDAEGAAKQMHYHVESSSIDKAYSKENLQAKSSVADTDTKRAKQQFAQRSRVRKLQYIAELERNVQSLQAEGCEVTAELEFLNQQNLILSMENKALKQRLESLAQEQMIKYFEHDVLEREINRLRALYQQQQHHQHQSQQQQKQPSSSHRRSNSKDMDSQFANLSLKRKEKSPSPDNASFLDRVS